ncbi:hypothetical protein [Alsobacter sp. SYSU BS001988]
MSGTVLPALGLALQNRLNNVVEEDLPDEFERLLAMMAEAKASCENGLANKQVEAHQMIWTWRPRQPDALCIQSMTR